MKSTNDPSPPCLSTVPVWAPLSEGVEPQPLHRPALRHSLRPAAPGVLSQLTAGSSPRGPSFIHLQLPRVCLKQYINTSACSPTCITICRWVNSVSSAADHLDWPRTWRKLARRWTRGIRPISCITMRTSDLPLGVGRHAELLQQLMTQRQCREIWFNVMFMD